MKLQEVILRAVAKKITWVQAAEIIGIRDRDRQMRRWKQRYEEFGYDGLVDRRLGKPSPKRLPLATVEEILRPYQEQHVDFNVRHFHEELREQHHIRLSYTWAKQALQTAGLVKKNRYQPIPAYSPQARGRGERNFGTWQGRLPQELRLHGIHDLAAANEFSREQYIAEFNRRFAVAAAQPGHAFLPVHREKLGYSDSRMPLSSENNVDINSKLPTSRPGRSDRWPWSNVSPPILLGSNCSETGFTDPAPDRTAFGTRLINQCIQFA